MASRRFTFLIDTNVFVTLEPFGSVPMHEPFDEAARFARRVYEHGHRLAIHEATSEDLLRDQDNARRQHNLRNLDKYIVLREVPVSQVPSCGVDRIVGVSGRLRPGRARPSRALSS